MRSGAKTMSRRQTVAELRAFQRMAFSVITHPLDRTGETARVYRDGRAMSDVAADFVKPNDRLSSLERIEIYNRGYWYRVLDCMWDDYPGLRAILGVKKFDTMRQAYLARCPSRSFTLRDLGSRLEQFLIEQPRYTAPRHRMCLDMARFEWAQVVAFDGPALPPLSVDDLLGRDPAKLRLRLQPYVTLLEMDYPLDDFVRAVKKRDAAMRSEASNAVDSLRSEEKPTRLVLPKRSKTFLAVHRHHNDLYYRRLEKPEYRILCALRDGMSLAKACDKAFTPREASNPKLASSLRQWFGEWAQLGWFAARARP